MKDTVIALLNASRKAVIGFVVSGGLSLLLFVGIEGDMTVREALQALATAGFTAVSVWVTRNK